MQALECEEMLLIWQTSGMIYLPLRKKTSLIKLHLIVIHLMLTKTNWKSLKCTGDFMEIK